ncbi:MAG TPA: DUF3349 domain-containing protein [Trebonia sp.]|jgi:hypothetical protein|nr:DUF3349 domain-containing protein [Trebonia sp.]
MTPSGVLRKIVDWLRAGYPDGVPPTDYVPLFALLRRDHLTDEDISTFAAELAASSDEDTAKVINEAVAGCPDCQPSEAELARVRGRLAAGGWPLARPGRPQSLGRTSRALIEARAG